MGNTCLFKRVTNINTTRIGTVFLIQQCTKGDPSAAHSRKVMRRRAASIMPSHHHHISMDASSSSDMANLLTPKDKELIERCWREHIISKRRDLFHKTMLKCIEASPKMNEIIACGRYCYRDLTKWPKLNRICQAQFNFFERLIYTYKLDEKKMHEACVRLGEMHTNFAQYGLKPHFLDIYQQQLLGLIARLDIGDKVETCIAFTHLTSFVIDVMIQAYSQKAANMRATVDRSID